MANNVKIEIDSESVPANTCAIVILGFHWFLSHKMRSIRCDWTNNIHFALFLLDPLIFLFSV